MVRIAVVIGAMLLVLFLAPSVAGQTPCPPDQVTAQARADSIFVVHASAERNCCSTLTLRMIAGGFVADFYEGEAEPFCRCDCCFDIRYDAHAFAAGHWLVRVWNDAGTELFGAAEVDVAGAGGGMLLGSMDRGDCVSVAVQPSTWSAVRRNYR